MIRLRVVVSDGVYSQEKVRGVWRKWEDNKGGTFDLRTDRLPLRAGGGAMNQMITILCEKFTAPTLVRGLFGLRCHWHCCCAFQGGVRPRVTSAERAASLKKQQVRKVCCRQTGVVEAAVWMSVGQLLGLGAEATKVWSFSETTPQVKGKIR